MGDIRSYRDLVAWQKAMELCQAIYRVTSAYPGDERFGLVAQTRRSAVSVPSNIAEGYGRGRQRDYLRFLRTARGSLYELETQIAIAVQLAFVPSDAVGRCADQIREVDLILCGSFEPW